MVKMVNKAKKSKPSVSDFPRGYRENKYSMYRLVTIIGGFVIVGLLVIMGAQYIQYYRANQELARYESRIEEQEMRQQALEIEIERLEHLDYIEVLARDRLGLVKPGEIIFQFED